MAISNATYEGLMGSIDPNSTGGRIFSVIASMSSVVVLLGPSRTVYGIYRDRSTKKLSVLPYIAMAMNCFAWCLYGVLIDDVTVWIPNSIGIMLAVTYSAIFHRYAKDWRPLVVYYILAAITCGAVGSLFVLEDPTEMVGTAAVAITMIFFASPLVVLGAVIKMKSVEALPFDLTLVMFENNLLWAFYGSFVLADIPIFAPAIVGLILATVQLVCHLIYGNVKESLAQIFCWCCAKRVVIPKIALDYDPKIDEKKLEEAPIDIA